MKRTAMNHTKMKRLVRALKLPQYAIVGILESLWHLTAREAPEGDIGKLSNEDIAAWIDWDRSSDELVSALVECKWLDLDTECRLVVHDWHEHCDDATKKAFARHKKKIADTSADVSTSPDKSGQEADVTGKNAPALPCLALPCLAKPEPEAKADAAPEAEAPQFAADPPAAEPPPAPPKPMTGDANMATVWMFQELGLANTFGDRQTVAQVIAFEARTRGDTQAAAEYLLAEAKAAMQRGEVVNAFWFKDRKFSPEQRAKAEGGSASGTNSSNRGGAVGRVERSVSEWDRAIAERRSAGAVRATVPADAGVLPTPRVQP